MNKVILMGRLTRDMEVRYAGELAIAKGSIAVDRPKSKDKEASTDFINLVAFGSNAEWLEKWGTKGTKFVIEGSLQTGSYKKEDGTTVYTTEVKVERSEFAESKKTAEAGQKVINFSIENNDEFMNIAEGIDEEIPFA